jgi:hypothetical protein
MACGIALLATRQREGSGEADLLAGKIVNLSKSLGRTARFTKPLAS